MNKVVERLKRIAAGSWQDRVDQILDSLVDDLKRLADENLPFMMSADTGLDRRRREREAKALIAAFTEVVQAHLETYLALEQELGRPLEVEVRAYTKLAFDLRRSALQGALQVLNVKAQVFLNQIPAIGIDPGLESELQILERIDIDGLKRRWS